jgi:putative DNA primase/helicase
MDETHANSAFASDTAPPKASIEGSVGSAGSGRRIRPRARARSNANTGPPEGFQQGSSGFQVEKEVHAKWLPKGFRLRGDGSILHEPEPGQWDWLCSPLAVEAATRNAEGESWGRLIRVRDRDKVWHEWAMPMAELAGAGDGYRARLLAMGLELAPGTKARNALHHLLTVADPQNRARCVSTLGWHGDAYMFPDEVIGRADGERYVLQSSAPLVHAFRSSGTLEGWREAIGTPAVGNSRLVVSISMAFAAPLLRPLGMEGGGVHWRGGSSIGKTTTGEVAGSVCGGGRDGYKVTWRATDNGIETVAAVHNDGLAVLDEIGQVSADALGAIAYMLANGQAKRRMTRDGGARSTATWSLLFLSTGEIGLADKLRESKRSAGRVMAGQEVRVLDLPADAGAGHGVFDHLAGFPSGQALADHLRASTAIHYGYPLRAYMRRLIEERPFDGIKRFVETFVAEVTPAGADGQVRRVAARFGIIAAGGEMAQAYGIVPWPAGEAIGAAKRLFGEWLLARGGSEPAEIEAGLAAIRHFIEAHGASRFVPWSEPNRAVQNRAGYSRSEEGGLAYYVFPEAWKSDLLAGHDASLIAREMVKRGMLKANADGKPQTKQRLPDGNERKVYVVLPAIFASGDGEA